MLFPRADPLRSGATCGTDTVNEIQTQVREWGYPWEVHPSPNISSDLQMVTPVTVKDAAAVRTLVLEIKRNAIKNCATTENIHICPIIAILRAMSGF